MPAVEQSWLSSLFLATDELRFQLERMKARQSTQKVELMFAAVSHPNRRLMLTKLKEHPKTMRELAAAMNWSIRRTKHHLQLLQSAGLVAQQSDKAMALYSLMPAQTNVHKQLLCCVIGG